MEALVPRLGIQLIYWMRVNQMLISVAIGRQNGQNKGGLNDERM